MPEPSRGDPPPADPTQPGSVRASGEDSVGALARRGGDRMRLTFSKPPRYPDAMKSTCTGLALLLAAFAAAAQAQVQDRAREQAIQSGQLRAGAAYGDLQQAQREAKRAEQEFINAQEAQRAAQKHAEDTKRQLDAAKKAVDAARQKEAQAGKAYDDALNAVDRARQPPPAK